MQAGCFRKSGDRSPKRGLLSQVRLSANAPLWIGECKLHCATLIQTDYLPFYSLQDRDICSELIVLVVTNTTRHIGY